MRACKPHGGQVGQTSDIKGEELIEPKQAALGPVKCDREVTQGSENKKCILVESEGANQRVAGALKPVRNSQRRWPTSDRTGASGSQHSVHYITQFFGPLPWIGTDTATPGHFR